ncbi:hypothetical protein [Sporichthya polymorpha]|uniref:hypothetical protein n=1 Tax=Sporichthya polymorpha TaxID=35751 RepID=UPI000369CD82|nr:hypothetical protein [Sporichthya polymorpha]
MIVAGVARRPSTLVAVGLLGGFAAAQLTGIRPLGALIFAAAGAAAVPGFLRSVGRARTAALGGTYVAALVGSHPLAHLIGTWPAVLTVTAAMAGVSEVALRSQPDRPRLAGGITR